MLRTPPPDITTYGRDHSIAPSRDESGRTICLGLSSIQPNWASHNSRCTRFEKCLGMHANMSLRRRVGTNMALHTLCSHAARITQGLFMDVADKLANGKEPQKKPGGLHPIIAIARCMAHPCRASFGSLPRASLSEQQALSDPRSILWVSGDGAQANVETRAR